MRFVGRAALAAVLSAVLSGLSAASAQTGRPLPPVEAFGSLPFISEPRLAPDGKHFAAIQSVDGRPVAVIYQVNAPAGTQPLVFGSSKWVVADIYWAKNDRLIVVTKTSFRVPTDPNLVLRSLYRAMAVSTGSDDPVELFSNNDLADSVAYNQNPIIVSDAALDDPDNVYMPLWTIPVDDRTKNDVGATFGGIDPNFRNILYRVDIHTGRASIAQDGGTLGQDWIMDGHGGIVARVENLHAPLVDRLQSYTTGSWRDLRDFDATGDKGAGIAGVSLDGTSLVRFTQAPRAALLRVDLSTGQDAGPVFADNTFDVDASINDEWTHRVIGASFVADRREFTYFDPAREAVQKGIEAVFPGAEAVAVTSTRAGDTVIVAVQSPKQPPTYYFLDRASHQATKIASEYPDLQPEDLGDMKPYPYKARDGLDIPAYLTLPPSRQAHNLPVVIMPHGGPDARDSLRFDWWAQFLANRGYAVLQPNFRGSSGYGRAFTEAGLHQWGLKMQDDISDGVKKLVADGIADPKRVCIVGASYGGYAALAGATFSPDLYACAVSVAGVSDLPAMLTWESEQAGRHSQNVSFWASRIGDATADAARLHATSPALHADQVRAPVLLLHGIGDTTVPIEQSEEERDALVRAGKKVEFVQLPGTDHYLSLAETRIQVLTEIERFLKTNIGN